MKRIVIAILLVIIMAISGVSVALAATKIAPNKGDVGHPFTIIDTPEGRLTDGTKAVFKSAGTEVVVDLQTHNPHKTAQGTIPTGIVPGDYAVFVRQPDGTEIEFGMFTVIGGTILCLECGEENIPPSASECPTCGGQLP
ncbi:hypothetical protein ACFLUE_00955 [Chloroflexota bacterium]